MFWPCETRTSTCRSFATISSGLYRFLAIAVLLDVKDIPQVGPLQWGWINLLNVLATISEHEAGFRSLKDTWADTTTPHGRLMLTVLGGLAEFERELIRARTSEGRERARARGLKMGRPLKLTAHQRREAAKRRDRDGETLADIARSYNVSPATISRLAPG